MAAYSNKFRALGTIKIIDPAEVGTDVLTQCTSSLSDKNARCFLSKFTLDLLPPKEHAVWKEAFQHFWRKSEERSACPLLCNENLLSGVKAISQSWRVPRRRSALPKLNPAVVTTFVARIGARFHFTLIYSNTARYACLDYQHFPP